MTYPGQSAASAENPEGTKALVISILGLLCCGPLAIWSLVISNSARGQGYSDTKTAAAFVISIVALVLWVVGVIVNFTVLDFGN